MSFENKDLMIFDKKPNKSSEDKIFIILYKLVDIDEDLPEIFSRVFSICKGRTLAYKDIESIVMTENVDVVKSIIITETKQKDEDKYYLLPFDDCVSIYTFCKSVENDYIEDGFNIDDYVSESSSTNSDTSNNDIQMSLTTEEQIEYKKLMEESKNRRIFLSNLKKEFDDSMNI